MELHIVLRLKKCILPSVGNLLERNIKSTQEDSKVLKKQKNYKFILDLLTSVLVIGTKAISAERSVELRFFYIK